jgi:hypothetical protein
MLAPTFEFDAEIWRHEGPAAWHFATLPIDVADEIRARNAVAQRPFGSLSVMAKIGATTWTTSIFADTKTSSYLLPIKARIRQREQLEAGQPVHIQIELRLS